MVACSPALVGGTTADSTRLLPPSPQLPKTMPGAVTGEATERNGSDPGRFHNRFPVNKSSPAMPSVRLVRISCGDCPADSYTQGVDEAALSDRRGVFHRVSPVLRSIAITKLPSATSWSTDMMTRSPKMIGEQPFMCCDLNGPRLTDQSCLPSWSWASSRYFSGSSQATYTPDSSTAGVAVAAWLSECRR